ncbi:hypothetical protein MHYP_G00257480 [Metynnis hypsauchen]
MSWRDRGHPSHDPPAWYCWCQGEISCASPGRLLRSLAHSSPGSKGLTLHSFASWLVNAELFGIPGVVLCKLRTVISSLLLNCCCVDIAKGCLRSTGRAVGMENTFDQLVSMVT